MTRRWVNLLQLAVLSVLIIMACAQRKTVVLNSEKLFAEALEESGMPIRPGIPGKRPFWNRNATRFIFAPAFEFGEVEGAARYRFLAHCAQDTTFEWLSDKPWKPIPAEIWRAMPVGYVELTAVAVDTQGDSIGLAGKRRFYRAAVFHGPYGEQARDYVESARMGLAFLFRSSWLQNWLKNGEPDPSYALYCYPSKMIAAVINGMIQYARMEPARATDALQIASTAARYLIRISEPGDSPLAFFPPTYWPQHIRDDVEYDKVDAPWAIKTSRQKQGQIMLIYPAEVAQAYLNLFEVTTDSALFSAAVRIADTYEKLYKLHGYWPLLIEGATGAVLAENPTDEGVVLPLIVRLRKSFHLTRYNELVRQVEAKWKQRMQTFSFEGQFEDQRIVGDYQNLANGPALEAARFLFDSANGNTSMLAKAEEFLRFAEDQFVVWSDPIPEPRPGYFSVNWFIFPCALEQYSCYSPIDAHAAAFIAAFQKAYVATGRDIYLAKAISLANSMTRAQDPETGRYPTWWMKNRYDAPGWLNCAVADAQAMAEFGHFLEKLKVIVE